MHGSDRRAMVKDAWGNVWRSATHRRDLSPDEPHATRGDGGWPRCFRFPSVAIVKIRVAYG
jgi:hypothetical protein